MFSLTRITQVNQPNKQPNKEAYMESVMAAGYQNGIIVNQKQIQNIGRLTGIEKTNEMKKAAETLVLYEREPHIKSASKAKSALEKIEVIKEEQGIIENKEAMNKLPSKDKAALLIFHKMGQQKVYLKSAVLVKQNAELLGQIEGGNEALDAARAASKAGCCVIC